MRKLVWILALAAAIAGPERAFGTAGDTRDRQLISRCLSAFAAAWNRHDPKALAGLFARDATLRSASGRLAKGHDEVEETLEEEQATAMKATTFAWIDRTVKFLAPDRAMIAGDCEITGITAADGKTDSPARFHVSAVLAKKDARWKILPLMFVRLPRTARPTPSAEE